jgi:hypothetical protein
LVYRKLIAEMIATTRKINTTIAEARANWLPRPDCWAMSKVKLMRMSVAPTGTSKPVRVGHRW